MVRKYFYFRNPSALEHDDNVSGDSIAFPIENITGWVNSILYFKSNSSRSSTLPGIANDGIVLSALPTQKATCKLIAELTNLNRDLIVISDDTDSAVSAIEPSTVILAQYFGSKQTIS
tara:strand:+ start:1059 stop:1412 length:354 start_codon:yes stop_codon:yes gene_type:complete